MPLPPTIPTATVTGGLAYGPDGAPATGRVVFASPNLQDVAGNVILAAQEWEASVVAGAFSIELPFTDTLAVSPTGWAYGVTINVTDNADSGSMSLPTAGGGAQEFGSLYLPDADVVAGASTIFVPITGGQMTGDLVLTTDLTVGGTIAGTFGDVGGINVMQLLIMGLSTAPIAGGEFVPNVDTTKLNISAMTGYIVNWNSSAPISATNPSLTLVNLSAQTALTPLYVPVTWWSVNSVGAIVQQALRPTPTERRQNIQLGATVTVAGVITVDQTLPVVPSQLNSQFVDFLDALGPFLTDSTIGNVLSANGANLTINKTAGSIFSRAFSQVPTYQDPHLSVLAAQTPMQFRLVTRLLEFGSTVSILNVGSYDVGGVVTTIPGGTNTATNFRVYGFANSTVPEQVLIQYGQTTYASLSAATAAIGAEAFVPNPASAVGALIGWISVTKAATDLSNPAQATFTHAGKFQRS